MKQDLLSLPVVIKTLLLLLVVSALGIAGAAGISLFNQDNPEPLPVAVEPDYYPKPRPILSEPTVKPIAEDFTDNNSQSVVLSETDLMNDDDQQKEDDANTPKPIITPSQRSNLRSLTDTLTKPVDAVTGLITSLL